MDESGANVFFTTRDRLVPKDRDDLVDLYDARENGGFANETEGSSGGGLSGRSVPAGAGCAQQCHARVVEL